MLDIWFIAGIALGTIVTGFCAIGSYDRGSDSVRRKSWSVEHYARRKATLTSQARLRRLDVPIPEGVLREAV